MIDSLAIHDLGKVGALQGDYKTTASLLISLAVKFQKYGKVLFIDANDQFNMAFLKKNYHKKPKLNLRKLQVARPFTVHQLLTILNELHKTIPENNAKAIVISGFDKLFKDPEISSKDFPFLIQTAIEELAYATKKFNTFTLISFSEPITAKAEEIQKAILPHISFCAKV